MATNHTNYLKHKDHDVWLRSTAVIEQRGDWCEDHISFGAPELRKYLVSKPYELFCYECNVALDGLNIRNY